MLPTLNRTAVALRPKGPFLEWVRGLLRAEGEAELGDDEISDQPHVYLLPASDSIEETVEYIAELADLLFESELESWSTELDDWPETRDWETLQDWFDVEILGPVLDTIEDELVLELPDEDEDEESPD